MTNDRAERVVGWIGAGCFLFGALCGWAGRGGKVELRPTMVVDTPQYLEGDPRDQRNINLRLETMVHDDQDAIMEFQRRLDRLTERIDNDIEPRVRGMQEGAAERARKGGGL